MTSQPNKTTLISILAINMVFATSLSQADIYSAAKQGDIQEINNLIASKANINKPTTDEITALMIAAMKGHLEIVKALLAAGADVNTRTKQGTTALAVAVYVGDNIDVVKALIAAKADVNTMSNGYGTPLMLAVSRDRLEVVQALISANADVNARETTGNDITPLMMAATRGNLAIVQALLAAKADIKATDNNGDTALTLAANKGNLEVVHALRKAKGTQQGNNTDQPTEDDAWKYFQNIANDINTKAANGTYNKPKNGKPAVRLIKVEKTNGRTEGQDYLMELNVKYICQGDYLAPCCHDGNHNFWLKFYKTENGWEPDSPNWGC